MKLASTSFLGFVCLATALLIPTVGMHGQEVADDNVTIDPSKYGADPADLGATPPISGIPVLSKDVAEKQRSSFEANSKVFRGVFKRLNEIRHNYPYADSQKQVLEMQTEWNELKIEGEAAIVEMQWLAMPIFRADPNRNSMFYRFLFDMLVESIEKGRYYTGYKVAVLFKETVGYEKPVEQIISLAAFMNNQHDEFEAYVNEAGPEGMLEQHQELMNVLEGEREKWAAEKPIRAQEALDDDLPRVLLQTSTGDVVVELFENEAPNTVANFLTLVEEGFYDGLTFHRVLAGFMAQGGCPFGNGTGTPGYRIPCECYEENSRKHFLGSLSMAHGGRDTGGCQFFICYSPQPELDGVHTVFGRVISGMEYVERFERIDPEKLKGDENPSKIVKATVLRGPKEDRKVKTLPLPTQ